MNTYYGKKTHSCHQCGYSSIKAFNLKAHMLAHSGVKPFVSKQCNFSFTQAGDLKTHILTHSGEKSFSCQQLEFSFTTVSNLKKHTLIIQYINLSIAQSATIPVLYIVQLLLRNSWSPQKTLVVSFRRKSFQLHTL